MKLALIGTGNLPLMQWILDGTNDDAIINMSALARRLGCSRSSLLDRIQTYGFDSAVKFYLNQKEVSRYKYKSREIPAFFINAFCSIEKQLNQLAFW